MSQSGKGRSKQKRVDDGRDADALVGNPIFQAALKWTSDEAMSRFLQARSPDEAWTARVEFEVAERFSARIMAYLRDGKSAAEELAHEQEASGPANKVAVTSDVARIAEYLSRAEEARKEYDAEHGPSGEVTAGA